MVTKLAPHVVLRLRPLPVYTTASSFNITSAMPTKALMIQHGRQPMSSFGCETSLPVACISRLLMLYRQMEMFAGVAASSMTTVHQFFCRKKFSFASWKSLKSIFTHLRSSSSQLKLSGNNSSSADWHGSNRRPSEDHQRLKTQDLESAAYEYNETKSPRVDSGHIVLTQDYSVTREQLHGTLFKPVVESHQFR